MPKRMGQSQLKTAVLGLNERGRHLLEAAGAVDGLEIQAVADKDQNLAEQTGEAWQCAFYDDYRQLIIQHQLDCLLVAAPMHSCDEYVRMAMKKKFNVLKLSPAARDFEEAAELVRLAEEQEIQFAVANPSRFAPCFRALRRVLEEGKVRQPFILTVFRNIGQSERPGWQADPKLAGGGVLLHDCYDIVDQAVLNFGVPQQVYSLSTNQAQDKQQRLYLTEDTAIVTMKFSETFIGNLIASRRPGAGPREERLMLYGKNTVLTVGDAKLTLRDGLGQVSEQIEYGDDASACMSELLKDFAASVLSPDKNKLTSGGRENLKNMAVVESAYLSARTGFPEEPARILQMASLDAGEAATV
ncbi:MAG: Gfo/Idh/MocA family oxidoreductase [Phycisphaerales bacterium]|nr:MAG: Gfo/Idh/MocA family oxidoreductase [Phycisphaerales bacterium]